MVRLLALLIALTASILSAEGGTVTGRVVKVYDGDTITVLDGNYTQHKIRLDGIDAPERGQDYGAKGTQALKAVLGSGQVVVEVTTKDKYGRGIGQVIVGQTNVNAWMVEKGWAWHYKRYSSDRRLAELELKARAAKVGLWADPRPPIPPWDYRAAQKKKKTPENAAGDAKLAPGAKINPNTAARDELMLLPGVGEVTANRIIQARPFRKAESLLKVEGIGTKTLETLKPFLQLP
jgi:competence ComEA-like helix-hairpin-helix protein